MSIWRWADWIAPVPEASRITLGEGNTPVVRSKRIGPRTGLDPLYFKLESSNPTSSYKDRFAAVAVSHMLAEKRSRCVATSSGNAGSALAAYCAAAGIACEIATLEAAPADKLKQMLAYGAEVYRIRGFGIDPELTRRATEGLRRRGSAPGAVLQVSAFAHSPVGMSGVQTISYELAEQIPGPIDHVFSPAGGGGLTLAVARGFALLVERGRLATGPRIECVQPEGNDTMAGPLRAGSDHAHTAVCTTTCSGLQVPTIIDGHQVIRACRASGGSGYLVTDEAIWSAQRRLAEEEGIFCEPAAAVALAGALQAAAEGRIAPQARVVCLVTGTGFKDQAAVDRMLGNRTSPLIDLADLETP